MINFETGISEAIWYIMSSFHQIAHLQQVKSTANNVAVIQKIIRGFNFIIPIVHDNRCLHDTHCTLGCYLWQIMPLCGQIHGRPVAVHCAMYLHTRSHFIWTCTSIVWNNTCLQPIISLWTISTYGLRPTQYGDNNIKTWRLIYNKIFMF